MSGIEIHQEPEYGYRRFAPCAAAMTFDIGDPVRLVTNQLADCIDDDTEILVPEIIGFACEPAEGITAPSRTTNAADGFGVVTNQVRSYWPVNAPGLLLRTRNFWATGGVSTQVEKEGTELGDQFTMTAAVGTNIWGIEETAPTQAGGPGTIVLTDMASFMIVQILTEDMNPIDAAATVALGTAPALGQGWVVFQHTGYSQIEWGTA